MNITLQTNITKVALEIYQKDLSVNLIDLINKTIYISNTSTTLYGLVIESLIDIKDTTSSDIIYI
jgi:hypothetical protein